MPRRWMHFKKPWIICVSLALAGVIGGVDFATGYDFQLSALFLAPICWAGWAVSRRAGFSLAAVCTIIWFASDRVMGHPYKHLAIPIWNALMLLAFFVAVVYLLSAFQDAHFKLVEAQSLLKKHNERLEETVRQRTAALEAEMGETKRLEKAKLQAERLAMVGTMAAQVAHEVRNPLGSITLNLDLIAKEVEKFADSSRYPVQEARVLVKDMREEVLRIQRVIEEYLRFARLPKMRPQRLILDEFLSQKLAFMESTFKNAGVRLRTELHAGRTSVSADPEQLWQAILNLLQNGLEAMPGGGTLTVSTQPENGQLVLRVADSGSGMNEEQLKQVFAPFFTTKPRGTGLGLPLTQRVLQEHGALIECGSVLGEGTTFTIHLTPAEGR